MLSSTLSTMRTINVLSSTYIISMFAALILTRRGGVLPFTFAPHPYPIFPDKIAQQKLAESLDACRWLHNRLLQELNEAKEKGIKLKTYDTHNMIPSLKHERMRTFSTLQSAGSLIS